MISAGRRHSTLPLTLFSCTVAAVSGGTSMQRSPLTDLAKHCSPSKSGDSMSKSPLTVLMLNRRSRDDRIMQSPLVVRATTVPLRAFATMSPLTVVIVMSPAMSSMRMSPLTVCRLRPASVPETRISAETALSCIALSMGTSMSYCTGETRPKFIKPNWLALVWTLTLFPSRRISTLAGSRRLLLERIALTRMVFPGFPWTWILPETLLTDSSEFGPTSNSCRTVPSTSVVMDASLCLAPKLTLSFGGRDLSTAELGKDFTAPVRAYPSGCLFLRNLDSVAIPQGHQHLIQSVVHGGIADVQLRSYVLHAASTPDEGLDELKLCLVEALQAPQGEAAIKRRAAGRAAQPGYRELVVADGASTQHRIHHRPPRQ